MTKPYPDTILDHCVIGSGPAGVFCSLGLLESGHTVHMIDIGKTLNKSLSKKMDALSQHPFSDWSSDMHKRYLHSCLPSRGPLSNLKTLFGSDYIYTNEQSAPSLSNLCLYSSQSIGGFSSIWGTSSMPFHENDLVHWPFGLSTLEPFYEKVLSQVPYCANEDDLSPFFPLYAPPTCSPYLHEQSSHLYNQFIKHKTLLNNHHIYFGYSRLMAKLNASECHRCGMCLTGCPYNLLYSSEMTLNTLKKHPNFHYISSLRLLSFQEKDHLVLLFCADENNQPVTIRTRRLYLATGAIQTSKIVLKSIPSLDHVYLKESPYFLLPAYTSTSFSTSALPHHSLSQLYLDICNDSLSPYWIHLQLYGYNHLYQRHIQHIMKYLYWAAPFLFNYFIEKLWSIQGFLHSEHSSSLKLTYDHSSNKLDSYLILNPHLKPLLSKLYTLLNQQLPQTGLHVLPRFSRDTTFGSSFHHGGTLPMHSSPQHGQTSINGKLWCSDRVHAVDSSIFPSIPSTTITLTIMANAYRIGRNS